MKNSKILKATSYDELLDINYGKPGTPKRVKFEENVSRFVKDEMLKEGKK